MLSPISLLVLLYAIGSTIHVPLICYMLCWIQLVVDVLYIGCVIGKNAAKEKI